MNTSIASCLILIFVVIRCCAFANADEFIYRQESGELGLNAALYSQYDVEEAFLARRTVFFSDREYLYAIWRMPNPTQGDELTCIWKALRVTSVYPPGHTIGTNTVKLSGKGSQGFFRLRKPRRNWPAGSYRVTLYLNNRPVKTIDFRVSRR